MLDQQRVKWFDLRRFLPGPWETDTELQDDEWERAEPEPASNVIAVRFAPPKIGWTRTEPVVPGLYAVRVPGGPRRVVEVEADARGRLMGSWSDVNPFPVARSGFEWADKPYLEPE